MESRRKGGDRASPRRAFWLILFGIACILGTVAMAAASGPGWLEGNLSPIEVILILLGVGTFLAGVISTGNPYARAAAATGGANVEECGSTPSAVAAARPPEDLRSVDQADASFILPEGGVLPVNCELPGGRPGGRVLLITPDGSLITYLTYTDADAEAHVQVFDRKEKKLVRETRATLPPKTTYVAFRPDTGIMLASAVSLGKAVFEECPLQAFYVDGGKKILDLTLSRCAFGLAMSPNGKLAASIGYDWRVFAWGLSTGQGILAGRHPDSGKTIGFTPDSRRLVSLSQDWTLKVWDIASRTCILTREGEPGHYNTYLSQDCQYAVVSSGSDAVAIEVSTGKTIASWQLEGVVQAVYAASNGSLVVWVSINQELRAWHVQGQRYVQTLPVQTVEGLSAARLVIPLDGSCVAVMQKDGTLAIWEAVEGRAPTGA